MVFSSNPKCSQCGETVSKKASFCPNCGERLAGGTRTCGTCGTENRGDAKFCKSCGESLAVSEAPDIRGHRWIRREGDFAVRVEADDLPGVLKRGVKVEPGTNAMIIDRGANRGLVPPGEYTVSNIGQRIKGWITGAIPERVTVLLVDVTPTQFEFHLGGRYTSDDLPVGISLRVMVEISDPSKFLVNVLKGGERLPKEDLRHFLYPEVIQTADAWLRGHTLKELVEDPTLRPKFELELEETLRVTFSQTGLRFLQVRTVELNLEPYDHIKGIRGKYTLIEAENLAELEGKRSVAGTEAEKKQLEAEIEIELAHIEVDTQRRWVALQKEQDLLELSKETQKVEMEERRADLFQRMRQAVMSDRMDEVRSEAEFEAFLDEIDVEKLLREKERADLLKTWKEEAEDHDKARAHMLARLEVEQNYELRMATLKLETDYDQVQLESEIDIARKRAEFEFELRRRTAEEELHLERERIRIENERREAQIEIESLERRRIHEDEFAEAQAGIELLAKMKEVRRLDEEESLRIQRVDELERLKIEQQLELEKMEAIERQRQAEREYELARIEKIGQLGAEALISISGSEQARILADLKKTETFQGMTEEQILALAAEHSPEVARALQEKYKAIVEGKASEREQEMYERLLVDQKEMLRQMQEQSDKRTREVSEAWDKSSERAKETSDRALDRIADTAQAFANSKSGGTTVVVAPGSAGGTQVVSPGGDVASAESKEQPTKSCPQCSKPVSMEAQFCEHCRYEFPG